jgi:hypothetical protein
VLEQAFLAVSYNQTSQQNLKPYLHPAAFTVKALRSSRHVQC